MIPLVRSKTTGGTGAYHIGTKTQVDIGDFDEWCLAGLSVQGRWNAVADSNGTIRLLRDPALAEEAYRICVKPKDILIHASTETGVIRAFATLLQMEADGNIPCVEISDSPRLSYRGLLLDCSRHFIPVDTIKKIIDCMMLLKMNTLHLHLSDDHGWRIKLDAFPALCREHDQFYTKEQLQDLVKYAHDRAVEIIPEIDIPGHASAFLSRYPEYSCTGEPVETATEGGIYDHILCAGKDEVFAAIEKILEEVTALFPSRYFHIGGDEVPKEQWERCPCCKQRMVDEQIETLEGLQGYFTKRVSSILAACGKTAIAWNDTLLADGKSAAGIIQYWSPDVSDTAMLRYIEQGGKFIFSNCYKCYLNFDSSLLPLKKVYETVQQIGEKPCSDYSGYVGAECALWTENISSEEDLEHALFPRILAFAENCWLGSGEYKDFTARAEVLCTCLRERGVTATEREMWDPEDERRLAGVKKYMNTLLISRQKREGIASAVKTVNRSQIKNFASEFLKPSDIPAIMKMLGGENPDQPKAETSDVKELCAYEKKHLDFMRKIAPECMVLLKSQKPFLIERGESVALYGGGARKTQKGGTGSGD